jgi:hypothetical protein
MATVELIITDVTAGASSGVIIGTPTAGGSNVDFHGTVGVWTVNTDLGFSTNSAGTVALGFASEDQKGGAPGTKPVQPPDTLQIAVSDNGYTAPVSSFTLAVSAMLNVCDFGKCFFTIQDFFSNTNALFAETTQLDGDFTTPPFGDLLPGQSFSQNTTAAATPTAPYSLTIVITLSNTDFGNTSWTTFSNISSSTSITSVPEPSTWVMMLLGFAGLGFAFKQSRRKVSMA